MNTSKEPIGYNFEIDGRMVEQVMEFNYMGVQITRIFMPDAWNDLVWRNKYMRKETK